MCTNAQQLLDAEESTLRRMGDDEHAREVRIAQQSAGVHALGYSIERIERALVLSEDTLQAILQVSFCWHCDTLQPTVTYCNTLQHAARHCSTLQAIL